MTTNSKPQSMYRDTDTFEQKVTIAERFLCDDICEEHRLFEIARKGETRFPQSGQIAYEMYMHRKEGRTTPAIIEVEPAAPVIAETPAPKMGDTVSGITERGKQVTGKITAMGCKAVTRFNYVHVSVGNQTHEIAAEKVTPVGERMDEDTYPVMPSKEELYQAMKQAEVVSNQYALMDTDEMPADHATYKRKVAAHVAFLRAQAAYTGVNNNGIIAYLYGTQKALQSIIEGVSSASQTIEVQVSTVASETPEIPVAAVMPALNESAPDWVTRMKAREAHWAPKSIEQFGGPLNATRPPVTITVKPKRAMDAAEQASEEGLQALLRKAAGGDK